jgi:hypothetical protein
MGSSTPYQCCGSGMFIPDPGSWFLPIPDPDIGSQIQKQLQKRGVDKIFCYIIFCNHKFYKMLNYFIFELLKKKVWAKFQRIVELFTQKVVTKLSKIWVWDPGSGINLFRIPDPGVKKAPDPGSRIRIRNTINSYSEIYILAFDHRKCLWHGSPPCMC